MGKFKVGDRVTLQKSSQHYGCGFSNPKDTLGYMLVNLTDGIPYVVLNCYHLLHSRKIN